MIKCRPYIIINGNNTMYLVLIMVVGGFSNTFSVVFNKNLLKMFLLKLTNIN